MNKTFKYRLYPNKEQQTLILKTFGCVRFIYNKMLADKIAAYEETKSNLNVTPAQYKKEYPFLKDVDSHALCNAQLHLQQAYKNFYRNPKTGFPKFKSKKYSKNSYTTNNILKNPTITIIDKNHIKLPKLGSVRFKYHRDIPEDYKIKSATITQTISGKYYIAILTEYEYDIPSINLNKEKSIALNYHPKYFYVDNTNMSPKYFYNNNLENKLKREKSKLSHMILNSKNYKKQKIKIGNISEKLINQKTDFVEKLSYNLSTNYDIICIEDKNLRNKDEKEFLGKPTKDNNFGMFRNRLEDKLYIRGKKLIKVNNTLLDNCCNCGVLNITLIPSIKYWKCSCGQYIIRDQNKAINILNIGLKNI